MPTDMKKYRVPKTAITEKGLKRLIRDAVKHTTRADWATAHGVTPQSVSAFMNEVQTAGMQIPAALGYRPQTIYLPLDEELICHLNPPRTATTRATAKVDATKQPVNKKGAVFDDREATKKRLKAKGK